MGRGERSRFLYLWLSSMFNFGANHLFLLSRTEYCSCALLIMLDRDTGRVYRLFDAITCCFFSSLKTLLT
jgi:hypothetical protein